VSFFFPFRLDESTDVCGVCQLLVSIRNVFNDGTIPQELLQTVPLHGKTREEAIFQIFYASLLEMNVPIHKLESVATGGATTMTSENTGLVGL
jgi:hypothetical protein